MWNDLRVVVPMDEPSFKILEIDGVLSLLVRHAHTPLGLSRIEQCRPSTDSNVIERELDVTTECRDYLETGGSFGLSGLSDPTESLSHLQIEDAALEPLQILTLQRLIAVGIDLRGQFVDSEIRRRYPRLAALTSNLPDLRRVLAAIKGKILPTGEIDDNASPELRRIRREINEKRSRIYRHLESLMKGQPASIQDEIVTIRNGRFVIPIRTDSRGQIQGVMHGLSSSGQTTYLEPLSVIDQNNDLIKLHELEEFEIAQILRAISDALRTNLPALKQVAELVGEVDFTQAKARLSREFDCTRPRITGDRRLILNDARHILLEKSLRESRGQIVPISLDLDQYRHVLVISGPNAGGKTVVLKTVGLIALMAQMGLHVPAAHAEMPVFEQILADIGDHQSIAANLSTFTAHMRNISEMTERGDQRSLILIDEVGTGTDPDEGAALAVAIVDYFKRKGATTLATTHYNQLKVWVSQTEGVVNASVEFDERTLRPTYRLIQGIAGASSGLEIARRMDLPPEIIDHARSQLDPSHLRASEYLKNLKALVDETDALRAALEEERQATAEAYARVESDYSKREAERRSEFEAEIDRVIREFSDESARLIESMKDKAAAVRLKKEADARTAELRRSAQVRLRKSSVAPQQVAVLETPPAARAKSERVIAEETAVVIEDPTVQIKERDSVLVTSLGKQGTVEAISGDVYTIIVGSMKLKVRRDDLRLIKAPPQPLTDFGSRPRITRELDSNFSTEVNVIGLRADEATDQVDKFLDAAALAGADSIRIIHGFGTGALRKAISELLKGHPHVATFHAAPPDQGGAGATIAEMRK